NISLTNLAGDYDIVLYNGAGTEIKRSENGGTTSETISNAGTAAGNYYVQVYGYNGANSTSCYTLNIGAIAAPTGCSSTYDVSTNGTTAGAAQIPLNTNVTGLISPSGDNDYYKFVITTGGTITITLTTLPADYDIRIYRSNGSQVASSSRNGTNSETINYTAAAGTYYARIYGYRNANHATSCYTLRVATGTASREEEYIVHPKQKVNIYPNPVKGTVNIQIEDNKDKAEIRLFDMYGRLVMQQLSSNENTRLNVSKLAPGVYLVKILRDDVEISTTRFIKE
ncbi:MAG: T9SS type A sorting domain-containing protein, partial [Flavisolibacter sp.]